MVTLRASFVPSALTKAIIQGAVRPRSVELDFVDHAPGTAAAVVEQNSKRMVALQLDVAEMSLGTLTRARDRGVPIVALPIFPGRRFLQPAIAVTEHSTIESPTDLRGKRAALAQFWQSASIWHRFILHTRYGVAQDELSWVTSAPERWDALPEPSARTRQDTTGRDVRTLLKDGDVDVALLAAGGVLRDGGQSEGLRRLLPDSVQAQRDFFLETGIFPIIHPVVMREELAKDEGLVEALCEAFEESKQRGLVEMIAKESPVFGGNAEDVHALFGEDPWPYGVERNRKTLEPFLEDVFGHQHLTDRRLKVEELFPARLPAPFA